MRKLALFLLLACPVIARASQCNWQQGPTDMTITATYDVFGSGNISVPQNFSFHCTPNTSASITITRGTNSAAYSPWRTTKITNPPAGYAGTLLSYNVWTPSNAPAPTPPNSIWGDGTGGSIKVNWTSSPNDKIYDFNDGATFVYVAPLGSDVPPGTYDDTLTASLAWGGGAPDTLTWRVIITVLPQCTVDTFSVAFGTYDPVGANLTTADDVTGTVNVKCTKTTAATVTLDPGKWTSAGSRRMQHTTNAALFLPYDIFTNIGRTTIWNTTNTNGGTSTSKLTGLGPGAGGFTAYGRIQPGLDVSAGSYKDTVQAVVNY
jgi:spore coat protein U-like protein